MGIGKAPLIGAADTDVTPVKKKLSENTLAIPSKICCNLLTQACCQMSLEVLLVGIKSS